LYEPLHLFNPFGEYTAFPAGVGSEVTAAEPPDLADVLREIDLIIYPEL
jgi:hypothetical protein